MRYISKGFRYQVYASHYCKGPGLTDLVAEFAGCLEEINVERHSMDEKSVGLISTQCPSP